jgi:hypothetical protein
MAANEKRCTVKVAAESQNFTDVGVRRTRLAVKVIAVIPDNGKPQLVNRSEHRRPRADNGPNGPSANGQPSGVSLGGTHVCSKHDAIARPNQRIEGVGDSIDVARVRQHDEGAAVSGESGGRCGCKRSRPVLGGQRSPDGARGFRTLDRG